jgi:hypothetical protein
MGRKLTSVTIPDTVTKIVDAAFGHCPNLVTVNLSKNVKTVDVSKLNMSGVTTTEGMFSSTGYDAATFSITGLNNWNVSKVHTTAYMFVNSKFSGDITKWDVSSNKDMRSMFKDSPLEKNKPAWYTWT